MFTWSIGCQDEPKQEQQEPSLRGRRNRKWRRGQVAGTDWSPTNHVTWKKKHSKWSWKPPVRLDVVTSLFIYIYMYFFSSSKFLFLSSFKDFFVLLLFSWRVLLVMGNIKEDVEGASVLIAISFCFVWFGFVVFFSLGGREEGEREGGRTGEDFGRCHGGGRGGRRSRRRRRRSKEEGKLHGSVVCGHVQVVNLFMIDDVVFECHRFSNLFVRISLINCTTSTSVSIWFSFFFLSRVSFRLSAPHFFLFFSLVSFRFFVLFCCCCCCCCCFVASLFG